MTKVIIDKVVLSTAICTRHIALVICEKVSLHPNSLEAHVSSIKINGETYTVDQIEAALDAAFLLRVAYAKGLPKNGGGDAIDWEDINLVHERADSIFPKKEVNRVAKAENGVR